MKNHDHLRREALFIATDYQLSKPRPRIHLTYVILTLIVAVCMVLLPFLRVVVAVKSPGILRPETEISQLKATSSGIIREINVKENDEVKKGQLLFAVNSPLLEEKESFLMTKLDQVNREIKDLDRLLTPERSDVLEIQDLVTSLYRRSFADYKQKLTDRQFRRQKVSQDFERNKKLYAAHVIAEAEFENYEFELQKAESELETLKQTQLNDWQKDLTNHEKDAVNDLDQLSQTQREKESLNVISPVSGSVQNIAGIYPGSQVLPGQDLAQITPNSVLIAEVYASPNDIGLLREGMDVRIRIKAFDYNQWGFATGRIKEISKDVQFKNNEPVYEIKCSLSNEYISLKNGFHRRLKKGMTLQARFSIIERSLWQLIYDKVDDWMNPALQP